MPIATKLLTAISVAKRPKGRHADGNGLYLDVQANGARYWTVILRVQGRRVEMRLGAFPAVGVQEARERRDEAKRLARAGEHPVAARKLANAPAAPEPQVPHLAFGVFADAYVETMRPSWRGTKTEPGWRLSLGSYAEPIRGMALSAIDTDDILAVLIKDGLWRAKPETAQKLQMRLAAVLDAAIAPGKRPGPNPARWEGHLSKLLPKRQKLSRGHHRALPYQDAPALFSAIKAQEGPKTRALQLLLLTASRTAEVRDAPWSEFDLVTQVWSRPAARMKEGRAHIVPLTPAMMAILQSQLDDQGGKVRPTDRVFRLNSTQGGSKPLDYNALDSAVKAVGAWSATTVHGLRSTFADWAGEETEHARETIEAALAHAVGDAAERAYRRGQAVRKRRLLMADWEAYLEGRLPLASEGLAEAA